MVKAGVKMSLPPKYVVWNGLALPNSHFVRWTRNYGPIKHAQTMNKER